jgi:hypothetical protein
MRFGTSLIRALATLWSGMEMTEISSLWASAISEDPEGAASA